MRKLKLLSLALMALFTTSLWAADDIYYVAMVQTVAEDGTLTGTSGTLKVVKYATSTGKYAETTAISWSLDNPSVGCKGSSVSKCSDIADYSKWQQGSGSQKAKGPKFSGTTTLSLGSLTATKITFIGYRNDSGSGGTLKVGSGDAKTTVKKPSSSFGSDCVIEYTGSFTGNVSVVASAEHCGVFVITVPYITYSVTIDPNGGDYDSTPAGWTKTEGKYTKSVEKGSFNVPAGLTNGDNDLTGWKDNHSNTITMPFTLSKDTILIAQWGAHTQHSDATLSALSVAGCTLNETFDPSVEAYTIDLPFYAAMPAKGDVTATKNDSYAANPEVSISSNVITIHCVAEDGITTKDYTITVMIAETPTASTSINIEQNILDNTKKWDVVSALTAANIVTDGRNGLDSLTSNGTLRNYPFLGLKLKKNNADLLKVIVPAGSALHVKFGSIGEAVNVIVNGEAHSTIAKAKDTKDNYFDLTAEAYVREVIFHSTANQTITLQQVKIGAECDPITLPALYTVTYNAGAGTCAKASDFVEFSDDKITLPTATPATGYAFIGWYTAASEGTLVGVADAKVTLTKDSTLYAQYSLVNYNITYTAPTNGTYTIKVGDASAVSESTTANYEQVVTLAAEAADGYRFNGWTVMNGETPVEVENNQFTMPAAAVTVSAAFAQLFAITCSSTDNTKGSVSADKEQAIEGETVTLTLAPEEGFKVKAVKVNEGEALSVTNNEATFEMPAAAANVVAEFEEDEETALSETSSELKAIKRIENGMLIIEKNGVRYNVMGQTIK